MGISVSDFEQMTPSEFRASWNAWSERESRREQGEWERARWLAMFVISPWTKKPVKARDIAVFPWEKQSGTGKKKLPETELSREEIMKRFEAAKKARGLR